MCWPGTGRRRLRTWATSPTCKSAASISIRRGKRSSRSKPDAGARPRGRGPGRTAPALPSASWGEFAHECRRRRLEIKQLTFLPWVNYPTETPFAKQERRPQSDYYWANRQSLQRIGQSHKGLARCKRNRKSDGPVNPPGAIRAAKALLRRDLALRVRHGVEGDIDLVVHAEKERAGVFHSPFLVWDGETSGDGILTAGNADLDRRRQFDVRRREWRKPRAPASG